MKQYLTLGLNRGNAARSMLKSFSSSSSSKVQSGVAQRRGPPMNALEADKIDSHNHPANGANP
jgi:hypothetical protein